MGSVSLTPQVRVLNICDSVEKTPKQIFIASAIVVLIGVILTTTIFVCFGALWGFVASILICFALASLVSSCFVQEAPEIVFPKSKVVLKELSIPFKLREALKNDFVIKCQGKDGASELISLLFEKHDLSLSDLYDVCFLSAGVPEKAFLSNPRILDIYQKFSEQARTILAELVQEGLSFEELLEQHCPRFWLENLRNILEKEGELTLETFLGISHPTFEGFLFFQGLPLLSLLGFSRYKSLVQESSRFESYVAWIESSVVKNVLVKLYAEAEALGMLEVLSEESQLTFSWWLYDSFSVAKLCEKKFLMLELFAKHTESLKNLTNIKVLKSLLELPCDEESKDFDPGLSYRIWDDFS